MTEVSAQGVAAATGVRRSRVRWWYIALPMIIVGVVNNVDRTAIGVVIANKQFLQDLNLVGKPVILGLFMSGFMLSYALTPVLWGWAMKWCGARIAGATGIVIWGVSMILSGIAPSANLLIAARVLLGVGEGFQHPFNYSFVTNWFPPKERSMANSMWLNGQNVGPAVAGVLMVAFIGAWGWRTAFFAIAAISLLIPLPMVIFMMRDRPRQHPHVNGEELRYIEEGIQAKEAEEATTEAGKSWARNYRFWLLVISWAFINLYFWGWATWMPSYFRTVRHFSFQAAGWAYSLNYVFTVVTVLGFGYLSDRFMRRAVFGVAGGIMAAIAMFLGGIVIENPYSALIVLIIALMCQQVLFLMVSPLIQSVVPRNAIARAVGVAALVAFLVGMLAPTFIGFLVQVSGYNAVVMFLALSVLIAGLLISPLAKEGY